MRQGQREEGGGTMVSETELARLEAYRGASAIPDDFDEFWDERMAEADAAPLDFEVVPADAPARPRAASATSGFGACGARRSTPAT